MSSHNIRSLLRAELSARRIKHPHASYSNNKSNLLSCTVCHLIIKSEALWEGHLRSANHRRNAQKTQQGQLSQQLENNWIGESGTNVARKRKADPVDLDEREDDAHEEAGPTNGGRKRKAEAEVDEDEAMDGRKKTKNQPSPAPSLSPSPSRPMDGLLPASVEDASSTLVVEAKPVPDAQSTEEQEHSATVSEPNPQAPLAAALDTSYTQLPSSTISASAINEDEWAAFEREVLPLALPNQTPAPPSRTHPSNAAIVTITAGPISASDVAAQKAAADERTARYRSREEEAEAEREDEGRRLQDEFEVQEEMEERVRRLRERRDQIRFGRVGGGSGDGAGGMMEIIEARLRPEGREADGNGGGGGGGNAASQENIEIENKDEPGELEDDLDEFDAWGLQ